jgi:hypothetical protein
MLFHQHDPELYPDICIEDIIFVFNNKTTLTISDNNANYEDVYCYIDIIWLDGDDETIIRDILEKKKNREDFYNLRSNKK